MLDIFGLPQPIAFHATLDISLDLTQLEINKMRLVYFYIECLLKIHPFTARASYQKTLPEDVPGLPLPQILAPNNREDFMLKRILSER